MNLYRNGGFALHSLKHLRLKDNQLHELHVPSGIIHLNQGGLEIMTPHMLPFVRGLVENVPSLVNEERCKDLGQQMVEVACKDIESDKELA